MSGDVRVAQAPADEPAAFRGRSRSWLVLGTVVVLAALAALAWWMTRPRIEDPSVAATELARSWSNRGLVGVDFAAEPTPPSRDDLVAMTADLDVDPPDVSVQSVVAVPDDELVTTALLAVAWSLPDDRTWSYETSASLVRAPESTAWEVAWDPRLLHPEMTVAEHLELGRSPAERGRILDRDGQVLVGPERVTRIGLVPARIDDLDETVDALLGTLDDELDVQVDGAAVRAAVGAAEPDHFVPVVVLRNDDYRAVEEAIYPLPGTTFRDDVLYLAPDRDFARFTLGTVGEVTAEQLEEQPGRWEPGDMVGQSGLQASLEDRLAGTPGWSVVAVGDDGSEGAVLHEVAPTVGTDVTITLDRSVQSLAQDALDGLDTAAAMAVVRPSDGSVLALANSDAATFDVARMGQLPPGSIFKVVTAGALLQSGLEVDSPVSCPNDIEVGDRTISNAGTLALGDTTFAQGFANSCNTVFIAESEILQPDALARAATQFGIGTGVEWPLGMPAFTGDVPVTTDRFDQALTSFGQGKTLVNPLDLATVMATVADGQQVLPTLVVGTEPVAGPDLEPLPDDVVADLQDLTRLVVTDGSGTAVQDLPGEPVHGKTGTADFTDEDGATSQHVWFAGYQGDLAVALVVIDSPGGSGGGTAAPLVATFLESLAG